MKRAAVFTFAQTLAAVELLEQRRQITHDALQLHFGTVHQLMAVLAVPLEAVEIAFWTRHLNDHTDCSRLEPLRRMPHMLGQQKYFSFFDWNFDRRLAGRLHDAKKNVAFQLVKEFFRGILVVSPPCLRSTYHRPPHS